MANKSNEWLGDWFNAQQNFWQSWADMLTKSQGQKPNNFAAPNWNQSLDNWWQPAAAYVPNSSFAMFKRMFDLAGDFTELGETGFNTAKPDKIVDSWLNAMEKCYADWASLLKAGNSSQLPEFMGINKTVLKAWDEIVEKMGAGFDFAMLMPGAENLKTQFMEFLNTPALGQSREHQQQLQTISRLAAEYHDAELAYKSAFARVGADSVKALRERIQQQQAEIGSLRDFYNLWVEVNEDIYGDFAISDEYQVIYGDLVNSLMAMRKEMNLAGEKIYKIMNLPTRTEINTVHKRLQESRRENRRLRAELTDLAKKIDSLSKPTAKPKAKAKTK